MPSKKEQYKYAKHAAPRPGDERLGAFTQAELAQMDQRFVERMEWAFRTGREQMRERAGIIRAQQPTEQLKPRGPALTWTKTF